MVLVAVVTVVWSILALLDLVTAEKTRDFKAIVTERWSIPSRMPFTYTGPLIDGAASRPGDVRPMDSMSWQFYVGTLDREKMTRENFVFALALEPEKLGTMMDGLDKDSLTAGQKKDLDGLIDKLRGTRQGMIMGRTQLANTNKRVGERFSVSGIGEFKGLDLEFEIIGTFPPGRYDQMGAIHRDYLNGELDGYPSKHNGRKHLLADRSLNLMWLKVPDTESFNRLTGQIDASPYFRMPAVKCETASSGMASWMEAFRDLIWGMRCLLAPACLITLALVIANAISISVRERRTELAVLKVLGFRPSQILLLVLGESLLLGVVAGLLGSGGTYVLVNHVLGGITFPIAFFDRFLIFRDALWWGPACGGLAALIGSILPAWFARNVKVAEVFAKVA